MEISMVMPHQTILMKTPRARPGMESSRSPHRLSHMNRDFMEYMRTCYPEVIKSVHPKYGTVINADDVRQQREKEDAETEPDLFRG